MVLAGYLVFAVGASQDMAALDKVTGVEIRITGNDHTGRNFVTVDGISSELTDMPSDTTPVSHIDLRGIERRLGDVVNIETARVTCSQTGRIHIDVVPMIPVARVFSSDGSSSYYINRAGKRLTADARYHVDVPVVTGDLGHNSKIDAVDLLPLMQHIASDSLLNSLTTSLKVTATGDVLLIPSIRGHVVNLGDPRDDNTADKFQRLITMYRKVLPIKGWLYYDTISVKFSGQVVATKAKKRATPQIAEKELVDPEGETLDNMLTTDAASGDNTPAIAKKK